MIHTLAIDIETFSSTDLITCGVYRYCQAEDFQILIFCYAIDEGPVHTIDMTVNPVLPAHIVEMLHDRKLLKTAYNAAFERTCLSAHLGEQLSPDQWECTQAKAAMTGLPLSLDAAAKALKLSQQKDAAGKALIKFFSCPCKPTKKNGYRTRNLPEHDREKWEQYKSYCAQDVRTELAIRQKIRFYSIPPTEVAVWRLDQAINDRGVRLSRKLVRAAIAMDREWRTKAMAEAVALTGLENPNSGAQLKAWLEDAMDMEIDNLRKDSIPDILQQTDDKIVKRVLKLRQTLSKSSIKKYIAMRHAIGMDGRARGLLQYYGANRTGRWAGRLIQVQNLPKNYLKDLDLARRIVLSGDLDLLEMQFGNVPDTLSQLIRTAFIASPRRRLLVSDFSAIEAVITAWLAGEQWRLKVFRGDGKIYEASAAAMFNVPIETIDKESPLRQKGKIAELALGYGGNVDALITMGALKMGLSEEELPGLVNAWRAANPKIKSYWKKVESAAIHAVNTGERTFVSAVKFHTGQGMLFITLPSKRQLCYINPRIRLNRFGKPGIVYDGMDQLTKQWRTQDTYGGKLTENIVQAIARDCLAEAMLRVDAAGYPIVMHVHDEIVCDTANGINSIIELNDLMARPIAWAPGLPLKAAGYELRYYRKD